MHLKAHSSLFAHISYLASAVNVLQTQLSWCLNFRPLLFPLFASIKGWWCCERHVHSFWTTLEGGDSGLSCRFPLRVLLSSKPSVLLPLMVKPLSLMWWDSWTASAPFSDASVVILDANCHCVLSIALCSVFCCIWWCLDLSCLRRGQEGVDQRFLIISWWYVTSCQLPAEFNGLVFLFFWVFFFFFLLLLQA